MQRYNGQGEELCACILKISPVPVLFFFVEEVPPVELLQNCV